ncbi:MAG: hypothetical protein FWD57_02980 [Polyangiaceae bacterium]|nr:hypothetical protein [Polyangiaceae bacterium]
MSSRRFVVVSGLALFVASYICVSIVGCGGDDSSSDGNQNGNSGGSGGGGDGSGGGNVGGGGTGGQECEVGQHCGIGKVCSPSSVCVDGCYIENTFYDRDVSNPQNACEVCSGASVSDWSPAGYGTVCSTNGGAGVCDGSGSCSKPPSIGAGMLHTCGRDAGGSVKCWGSNEDGQVGDGSTDDRHVPTSVGGLASGVKSVAAGLAHSCAITSNGGVSCWGDNGNGQLGDGTTVSRAVAAPVTGLGSSIVDISAGDNHTCGITIEGEVVCWGQNNFGQLGNFSKQMETAPVAVAEVGSGAKAVACGGAHSCAITSTGEVMCWGSNTHDQLGTGQAGAGVAALVSGLGTGVVAITAGFRHSCAVTSAGAAMCWGQNDSGQVGNGSITKQAAPIPVSGLNSGVIGIAAGQSNTCALITGGSVKCWGNNALGQIGDGTLNNTLLPVKVSGIESGAISISAGGGHNCVVMSNGDAKCWGYNSAGQIGDGSTTNQSAPVSVVGFP